MFCFSGLSADGGHQQAYFVFIGLPGIHDARYMPVAQDHDTVAELEENIQVLADIEDGDAFFLLLRQQVVDGVGSVDIEPAHRIGTHQDGGRAGDLASYQDLLHIAA